MIRILIVDDSPTARLLLRMIFETDPELVVVGEARNGSEALRSCVELQPDIVTMDINMPGMDGFEAIRLIMSESPRPIIVLTAAESISLLDVSFKALALGALSVMEKPGKWPQSAQATRSTQSSHDAQSTHSTQSSATDLNTEGLINEIKTMSGVKVVSRPLWLQKRSGVSTPPNGSPARAIPLPAFHEHPAIIAIGVSTGGPPALQTILQGLASPLNVPIVIVQHISRGFITGLSTWLSQTTHIPCKVAEDNQVLQAGTVYLAPDDRHLLIRRGGVVNLDTNGPIDGHRPSVTALFESLALNFGSRSIGVLMTGMGQDGARGLLAMHTAGAYTIAQDEASCVVFGMPKAAIDMGAATDIVPVDQIAERLMTILQMAR